MEEKSFCACGCGEEVKPGRKFKRGHNQRLIREELSQKKREMNLAMWQDPEMREKWSASKRGERHPMYGKKHREESKQKMSESQTGKIKPSVSEWISQRNREWWADEELRLKFPSAHSGEKHPRYGVKDTEEARLNMSLGRIGIKMSLEARINNSIAHGGDGFSFLERGDPKKYGCEWYDEEYKADILIRDNFECQCSDCEKISDNLIVHHIDEDKNNNHPNNLVTLCRSCHARIHKTKILNIKFKKEERKYSYV